MEYLMLPRNSERYDQTRLGKACLINEQISTKAIVFVVIVVFFYFCFCFWIAVRCKVNCVGSTFFLVNAR